MPLCYKDHVILYRKGMNRDDVINAIKKRLEDRALQMKKRERIYNEYKDYMQAKQDEDARWLAWYEKNSVNFVDERKDEK